MNRLLMLGLGYGFLGLGVLGLFLPFLQGFLFILVGLLILSRHAAWAQRTLDWLRRRHPKVAEAIDKADAMADRWSDRTRIWWRGVWCRLAGS